MPNSLRLIRGGLSRYEIDTLNDEAWRVRRTSPGRSAELSRLTRSRSESTDYRRGIGQAQVVEAYLAYAEDAGDVALQHCIDARSHLAADGATPWLAWAHMITAHVASEVGEIERAQRHYELARQVGVEAGDTEAAAAGSLNAALVEPDRAVQIRSLREVVEVFREADLLPGLSFARYNLAELLLDDGQVDEAAALAAVTRTEAVGAGLGTIRLRSAILQGRCAAAQGHYDDAVGLVHAALEEEREADAAAVAEAGLRVAEIQHAAGDTQGAIESLQLAVETGPALTTHAVDLARRLADYQAEIDDYDAAYATLQQLHAHRAQITAEQVRRRVAVLEVLYRSGQDDLTALDDAPPADPGADDPGSLDPLTGLPDADRLDRELAALSALAVLPGPDDGTHRRPLCLALIDVDELSIVNAELGHVVGDSVLRQIAAVLESSLPPGALLFRAREEDFALLLADLSLEDARLECERLRVVVDRHLLAAEAHGRRFTVSIGVTEAPWPVDVEALADQAEAALTAAKNGGRNRIVALSGDRVPGVRSTS